MRKIQVTTQGEPRDTGNLGETYVTHTYNERGEIVHGEPIWKARIEGRKLRGCADNEERSVITGVQGVTFGRLDRYELQINEKEKIPLHELTVKQMTTVMVEKKTKAPTCERRGRWPVELRMGNKTIPWTTVWDTFKIGVATPVDYGTRFRMLHGDLGTRSKRGEPGGCRLGCGCPQEKHIHLLRCPILRPL